MSELVENIADIIRNIKTISGYAYGSDSEKKFHNDRIKNGKWFVAYKENGKYIFSPSKFVGYKENNTDHLDELNNRQGGFNNNRLIKILGNSCADDSSLYKEIDDAYSGLCWAC